MESANLKIILHYAKDLKDVKHFRRMSPYVIVRIARNGSTISEKETRVAKKGHCDPTWEFSMLFNIKSMSTEYTLLFEIKHKGEVLDDRTIGKVQVRFADLLAKDAPKDKVCYQVIVPSSGEKEGKLVVSHKFSKLGLGSNKVNGATSRKCAGSSGNKPGEIEKLPTEISAAIAYGVVDGVVEGVAEGVTAFALNEVFDCDTDNQDEDEDEVEDEDEEEEDEDEDECDDDDDDEY